jgi:hypothetical protein
MLKNNNKSTMTKKYTSFSGCFDGHGNLPGQYNMHCLMENILGYIRGHWMPPLGQCLHRITLATTRVIEFGTQKGGYGDENRSSKANSKKTQNRPSTQLIEATSCIKG